MRENPHVQMGEWRRSYAHVFQLSALGCAWEFLCRNGKLQDAWKALKPGWRAAVGDHGLNIVHSSQQSDAAAPCLWASSLDDAATASVIWNPARTRHVLKLIALPPHKSFGGQILDLDYLAVEKTLLLGTGGSQHLLLRDGLNSLQLNIRGAPITEPVALYVDTAIPEGLSATELALLQNFRALRTTGHLLSNCCHIHPYAKRAARVLIALDGYLAGLSHSDIAIVMFGRKRVDRDWNHPGEHLRDTVRRAIARGVRLMEGGYAIFLR
jgi:hypothetical protein